MVKLTDHLQADVDGLHETNLRKPTVMLRITDDRVTTELMVAFMEPGKALLLAKSLQHYAHVAEVGRKNR